MASKPLVVHRRARNEASAAVRWYARRSPAAAARFSDEVARVLNSIELRPEGCPPYLLGTRRCLLKRFPYLIVYVETADA
jgi:toxin ParE2